MDFRDLSSGATAVWAWLDGNKWWLAALAVVSFVSNIDGVLSLLDRVRGGPENLELSLDNLDSHFAPVYDNVLNRPGWLFTITADLKNTGNRQINLRQETGKIELPGIGSCPDVPPPPNILQLPPGERATVNICVVPITAPLQNRVDGTFSMDVIYGTKTENLRERFRVGGKFQLIGEQRRMTWEPNPDSAQLAVSTAGKD